MYASTHHNHSHTMRTTTKNEEKCNTQQRKTPTMLMCVLPKAVNSALFYENWRIDVITNVGSACLSTSVTSYYHTFESV